eukprot:jgi/Psemu1/301564/fgenesh1_kg.38_\
MVPTLHYISIHFQSIEQHFAAKRKHKRNNNNNNNHLDYMYIFLGVVDPQTIAWAERRKNMNLNSEEVQLRQLYRQSILDTGVRLVDTPTLSTYQSTANFVQANPFKCIAAIGMPSVAYIFHGQGGKDGVVESFQMRLLHTRVFGQFAVICTLLSVMSLKEVMDRYGRYVTEDDIESRIQEMEATRTQLMTRAEYQQALRRS